MVEVAGTRWRIVEGLMKDEDRCVVGVASLCLERNVVVVEAAAEEEAEIEVGEDEDGEEEACGYMSFEVAVAAAEEIAIKELLRRSESEREERS